MTQIVPLETLRAGERGRVCDLDGAPDVVHRLKEMGLREGTLVTMLQTGSPCILDINHHRLSCRLDHLVTVFVELVS